ncbi:MAG: phosphonate ABC transporter substrate-binding protein [Desulfobacteraceae bacterium]|nr:MAG: phosphonate ABC transporter substrate-binding protein [Desulfobacteraceae bacterium]
MKLLKHLVFGIFLIVAAAMIVPAHVYAAKTLRLAVTDIEGLEMLQREFGAFRDVLSEKTGMEVKFFPVPNRTAAVEAVKSENVDFVLTGPAEYVVFKKLTDAEPVVGFSRPDYFCSVVVLADSGINSVAELKTKKVAIGGVGSTSKHLAPMQIMADNGLDPLKDVSVVHTSVDLGWQALKRGDVSAWGMTTDKFIKLRAKDKELQPGAFKVIARGPDLPNDVLLAAKHVDPQLINTMKKVFIDHSDELVAAILQGSDNKKYSGMKFLPTVKDQDYNYVRSMYRTIGYPKFAGFVE